MGMPGGWELAVIALIALLLFGSRLPSIMRSMGQGVTEFKKGVNDLVDDTNGTRTKQKEVKKKSQSFKDAKTNGINHNQPEE